MKVLLATDGSSHANDAGRLLAHLPHRDKLDLTILSVVKKPDFHGLTENAEWMDRCFEAEAARAYESCGRIAQMFDGANVTTESIVAKGHVTKTILSEAKSRDVDLIVLGAVGHSLLGRITLGSVSDAVATHAPCSVLVVRPTNGPPEDHHDLRVCIAFDGSNSAKFSIAQLAQFDWRCHTKIDVVSVYSPVFTYMDEPIEHDQDPLRASLVKSNGTAVENVHDLSPSVTSHIIDGGHVGDCLAAFTEEHHSDLIVMGDTGLGLFGDFFLGSASKYVLRHAQCSVWIARDKFKSQDRRPAMHSETGTVSV